MGLTPNPRSPMEAVREGGQVEVRGPPLLVHRIHLLGLALGGTRSLPALVRVRLGHLQGRSQPPYAPHLDSKTLADKQENSLTIVTLPSILLSLPPSDPSLPSQELPESLRFEPSSRTLSSVSHPVSERSSTWKSQDGRSLVNT